MTRLIDAEQIVTMELFDEEHEEYYKKKISIEDMIATYTTEMELPTVDAVPISFIEKRIEQLKSHADYEFEANGGYAGGSQYRQWELECLLDAWAERKEE